MFGGKHFSRFMGIVLVAVWAALLLAFFVNAMRRVGGPTGDFVHFYDAARAMVHGEDLYSSGRGGYIYPPLLAFLYTPLAGLSETTAATVLLVVNMSLLLLALFLTVREVANRFGAAANPWTVCTIALAAVLLTADKVKGELQMWQTNLLLLFLFAAALRLLDRRPTLAGAALGLAFNIKYWPILLLPYFLLRRRWAAAGVFVASIAGFALLPAIMTGWDVNLRNQTVAYSGLLRMIGVSSRFGTGGKHPRRRGRLQRFHHKALARLPGAAKFPALPLALSALVALAALAAVGAIYRRNGVPFLYRPDGERPDEPTTRTVVALEWAGLLTAALVFSPQTNTRHLSLLLFVNALAALLLLRPRDGVKRWPLLIGTTLLLLGSPDTRPTRETPTSPRWPR